MLRQLSENPDTDIAVILNRPIGSCRPNHKNICYPINYGYIPGVLGGDGEEFDVYLLGVDKPVEEYSAVIIGIAYRENDVEDKLIAAPAGMSFTASEIESAIHFQEQHYKTNISTEKL